MVGFVDLYIQMVHFYGDIDSNGRFDGITDPNGRFCGIADYRYTLSNFWKKEADS